MAQTNLSHSSLYGFNMSQECEADWQESHDLYKNHQLSPSTLRRIALFMLDGLDNPESSTGRNKLEDVVYALASEMHVSLSSVRCFYEPNSNLLGGYIREGKQMVLNLANLSNEADVLTTIIHELRHAQQYDFMHSESELASLLKNGIENYTRSTGKAIKDALYFSNLVEVDAELLSYYFAENIFEQLEKKPEFMEHPKFKQQLERAKQDHAASKREFEQQINQSVQVVDMSKKGRNAIFNLAYAYSKELFSEQNRDCSHTSPEGSKLVVQQLDALINGSSGKQVIDFSSGDLYMLKLKIFEGVSSYDILRHLDDPFIQYIKTLEDQFEIVGQDKYERYVSKIQSKIAKPLTDFVKKYNLPYTEGDYTSMLETYFENYHEIRIQNLINGKEDPSMCIEDSISLWFNDLRPRVDELHNREPYLSRIPLELLEERAENSVRNRTYSAATSIIPEFTSICEEQITKNMLVKYLKALNVPESEWYDYTIHQATEVLKKSAPTYIMQHIFDNNISEFHEELISFCLKYGDVSLERLHKELLAHPIIGFKLRSMKNKKYEELPDMLRILSWHNRPIKYILDPKLKKKEEQSLS